MSSWTIYWITRLDAVGSLLLLASILAAFGFIVCATCPHSSAGDPVGRFCAKSWAVFGVCALLCPLAFALTPTTKEMCAIIAIPAIVNSEDAQEIGSEVVDLAKDWLKELKPQTPNPNN